MTRRVGFIKDMPVVIKQEDGSETNLKGMVDPGVVAEINADFDQAFQFIARDNLASDIPASKINQVRIESVVLGTDERTIQHGLDKQPTEYTVYPKSGVVWYESKAPDTNRLFLKAADTLTVDIVVKG